MAGNLLDVDLAQEWSVPLLTLPEPIPVMVLDSRPLGSDEITQHMVLVSLQVEEGNREQIQFHIVDSPDCPLILGHPWLSTPYPHID